MFGAAFSCTAVPGVVVSKLEQQTIEQTDMCWPGLHVATMYVLYAFVCLTVVVIHLHVGTSWGQV
jgi:hypothetical protein